VPQLNASEEVLAGLGIPVEYSLEELLIHSVTGEPTLQLPTSDISFYQATKLLCIGASIPVEHVQNGNLIPGIHFTQTQHGSVTHRRLTQQGFQKLAELTGKKNNLPNFEDSFAPIELPKETANGTLPKSRLTAQPEATTNIPSLRSLLIYEFLKLDPTTGYHIHSTNYSIAKEAFSIRGEEPPNPAQLHSAIHSTLHNGLFYKTGLLNKFSPDPDQYVFETATQLQESTPSGEWKQIYQYIIETYGNLTGQEFIDFVLYRLRNDLGWHQPTDAITNDVLSATNTLVLGVHYRLYSEDNSVEISSEGAAIIESATHIFLNASTPTIFNSAVATALH